MAKTFKDLSPEQLAKFQAVCEKFGIDHNNVPALVSTEVSRGGILCGHPAGSSHFPISRSLTVNSIQELNALGGVQDEHYTKGLASDSTVDYPPEAASLALPSLASCNGDVCQLKDSMSLEQHAAVAQAMNAYLLGNSAKVANYEEQINAIHFPMTVAAQAAQDIVITANNPLIIDNPTGAPTTIVAGTVTVKPGGYILMKTPLNLNCQVFIQE